MKRRASGLQASDHGDWQEGPSASMSVAPCARMANRRGAQKRHAALLSGSPWEGDCAAAAATLARGRAGEGGSRGRGSRRGRGRGSPEGVTSGNPDGAADDSSSSD
ncbi:unnamed protein product [Prorocentrum cordatum]|uniref:Uncharacterized protein n=1 Tax=Prorocentrum cordatum TaxID=2364126 RepID=A0ABN9WBT2_9DINO|nr:unnamed protein product [Polarella glacialis]